MSAYLNNVFLIDEIYIVGPKLDHLKIRTVLGGTKTNIFAQIRLRFVDKNVKKEYTFPISECGFCEKNNPTDTLMRLQLGGMKFYAHRSRTVLN